MLRPVFELRLATSYVAAVQDATLRSSRAGLIPEHGLFGSPEWWSAVESGDIPTHRVSGIISRVYMSGHNDYPEFEVTSGGTTSSWTREGDDKAYILGHAAAVEYVLQRFKTPLKSVGEHSKSVLRILIDDGRGA
jgi:hypothetical protein